MYSARYLIFEPSKKKITLNRNIIAYGLICLGFIVHYLPININETFRIFYILITFVIFIYFLITSLFSYQPLNGEIKGEIEFEEHAIIVNGNRFKLIDLNSVYLHYEDYFGERKHYIKGDLNQTIRQGVKNYFQFIDTSNFSYKVYFKVESKLDSERLIPFIYRYNEVE